MMRILEFILPVLVVQAASGCVLGAEPGASAGANAPAHTYFVDASGGNDANGGLAPQSAWQSLERVNAAPLRPGDKVLFKRGESWRGQLVPHSGQEGAPVMYGAYGEGAKPLLLGSMSVDRRDWQAAGENLWTAGGTAFSKLEAQGDLGTHAWLVHQESGAKVRKVETRGAQGQILEVTGAKAGKAEKDIQLYTTGIALKEGEYYAFTFRAKATERCLLSRVQVMGRSAPWRALALEQTQDFPVENDWREFTLRFKALASAANARVTFYLGGLLSPNAVFSLQPSAFVPVACNPRRLLSLDIGNILFDGGKSVGIKKWRREDLKQPGDYWYDRSSWQVWLYALKNPAEAHQSLELALRRHIVEESGASYVLFEGLALRYGAAHGFSGASTHHIIIRNCDISWIGGAHQWTTPEGRPVRFGNGIEFWGNAHDNLVENCRLWEIYDAALTNQGNEDSEQYNLTYRHNVIWNAEYSFEYWNRQEGAITRNIRFENNTCVNAGSGWGHAQRPDPSGRHVRFGDNPARTTEFYISRNIFYNATDSLFRMENDWRAGLHMDRNCWFQPSGVLAVLWGKSWSVGQFQEYQTQTGLEAHSVLADPKFVNAQHQDFRLSPDNQLLMGARHRLQD
jgi:hypothetical protein